MCSSDRERQERVSHAIHQDTHAQRQGDTEAWRRSTPGCPFSAVAKLPLWIPVAVSDGQSIQSIMMESFLALKGDFWDPLET